MIDAGVGGGATSLDVLSDVIITLPHYDDEWLFISGISGQYENTKIKNGNLQAGVFSNIEGIGVQNQELDKGGFNIINSPGGFATSFIGFDADDNLRMNDLDILRVRNIDFDDPASNIQGLVGLNFFAVAWLVSTSPQFPSPALQGAKLITFSITFLSSSSRRSACLTFFSSSTFFTTVIS